MVCERCGGCCGDNHFWVRALLKGFKEHSGLKDYVLRLFPSITGSVGSALESVQHFDFYGMLPEPVARVKKELLDLRPPSEERLSGVRCVFLDCEEDGLTTCLIHPSVLEEELGLAYDPRGGECQTGGCFNSKI